VGRCRTSFQLELALAPALTCCLRHGWHANIHTSRLAIKGQSGALAQQVAGAPLFERSWPDFEMLGYYLACMILEVDARLFSPKHLPHYPSPVHDDVRQHSFPRNPVALRQLFQ
jgi:hypothetical protein